MPVTYHYYPDHVVVLSFFDPVTFDEWITTVDAVLADPAYSRSVRVLSDRRSSTAPDTHVLQQITHTVMSRPDVITPRPVAILTSETQPATSGMNHLEAMLSQDAHVNVRTFVDYDQAMCWLKAQPIAQGAD